MNKQTIKIAGIDISRKVAKWKSYYPDTPLTTSIMFDLAIYIDADYGDDEKKPHSLQELKALKKELLANPEKYKDVHPFVYESCGNNIKDMANFIDNCIYELEHPGVIID